MVNGSGEELSTNRAIGISSKAIEKLKFKVSEFAGQYMVAKQSVIEIWGLGIGRIVDGSKSIDEQRGRERLRALAKC